jgi:hypothetical protein
VLAYFFFTDLLGFNNIFLKIIQVGADATISEGVNQFVPSSVNVLNGTVVTFQFTGM